MELILKLNPINSKIELYVLKCLDLAPPTSYSSITTKELNNVYTKTIQKFSSDINLISNELIKSIRSSWVKNHMMETHKKMHLKKKLIIHDYVNKVQLEKLVVKYDGSPLNILRLIFDAKYKMKLGKLIINSTILEPYDLDQLHLAIKSDAYALINQDDILKHSNIFEKDIEKILIRLNIQYKTQEQLATEQIAQDGKPSNTPDFLILSELYINNNPIKWIDAKNFYGANIYLITDKIKKQTKKYINEYGPGGIIFKLSFNSKLNINNILLIDWLSFSAV